MRCPTFEHAEYADDFRLVLEVADVDTPRLEFLVSERVAHTCSARLSAIFNGQNGAEMVWMKVAHRTVFPVLCLIPVACPAAMAGEAIQTTTAPDGSRKVTPSLRNLFRKGGAAQPKSTGADNPLARPLSAKNGTGNYWMA